MATHQDRSHWAQCLVTSYFVDLELLGRSLADALPDSLPQLGGEEIGGLMLRLLDQTRAGGWLRLEAQGAYIGVPLFIRNYSKWVLALDDALGFQCADLDCPDEWADEQVPELQAILRGLTDRLRQDLPQAKGMLDPEGVNRAFRVMLASKAQGDSPHQTSVKAELAMQGLRRVK